MEFLVLSKQGIPEDAILSVRAGQSRRQIPVSYDKPLLFPSLPMNSNPFKIDVLLPVATQRMEIKPKISKYDVSIGDDMSLSFCVKEALEHCGKTSAEIRQGLIANKRPSSAMKQRLQSAVDGREYLDEHNLFNFIQGMVKYLLTEKPTDPYDCMVRYVLKRRKIAKEAQVPQQATPATSSSAPPATPTVSTASTSPTMQKPEGDAWAKESKLVSSGELKTLQRELAEVKQKTQECIAAALDSGELAEIVAGSLKSAEVEMKAKAGPCPEAFSNTGQLEECTRSLRPNSAEVKSKALQCLDDAENEAAEVKLKAIQCLDDAENEEQSENCAGPALGTTDEPAVAADLSAMPGQELRLKARTILEDRLATGELSRWSAESARPPSQESTQDKLELGCPAEMQCEQRVKAAKALLDSMKNGRLEHVLRCATPVTEAAPVTACNDLRDTARETLQKAHDSGDFERHMPKEVDQINEFAPNDEELSSAMSYVREKFETALLSGFLEEVLSEK